MKDYYGILGMPETCSQADVKQAFRKLAFKCHPDTNSGDKQAEQKFKEIYEAYGVLGEEEKRRQYDHARKSPFARAGMHPGFNYSQQDIFRNTFSNRSMYEEMRGMFSQAGLRFDADFLNRVFASGNGVVFQFFSGPGGSGEFYRTAAGPTAQPQQAPVQQGGFFDRWLSKIGAKLSRFVLNSLTGTRNASSGSLDHYTDFTISAGEAQAGGEKELVYSRNGELKKFMVIVPPGVKAGTKIRLRGMGRTGRGIAGDLYLKVVVRD